MRLSIFCRQKAYTEDFLINRMIKLYLGYNIKIKNYNKGNNYVTYWIS